MAIRLNVTENTPYYIGARAYVTQTADGAILTVVDKEGVTTATILNGINGRSIASCTLNENYTLTILYTDGTSDTTTSIRGAQGVSGVWVGDEAPSNPDYNVWVDPTNEDGAVLKVKDDDTWETIDTIVGEPAGFGTVTATADINVGTPSVTVTSSGENTAKNFAFAFHNLGYDDSDLQSDMSDLQSDMGVLEARMDSFTNLAEGSTTGDAELIDGRVGADGVTYNNIGTAIRTQVSDLKDDLDAVEVSVNGFYAQTQEPYIVPLSFEEGSISDTTGADTTASGKYRSKGYTKINGRTLLIDNIPAGLGVYVFRYDANKDFVTVNSSAYTTTQRLLISPSYVRIVCAPVPASGSITIANCRAVSVTFNPIFVDDLNTMDVPLEGGKYSSGYTSTTAADFNANKRTAYFIKTNGAEGAWFNDIYDYTHSYVTLYCYGSDGTYLGYVEGVMASTRYLKFKTNTAFVRFYFAYSGAAETVSVTFVNPTAPPELVKNFRVARTDPYEFLTFKLTDTSCATARLMLPPNYTTDGKKVPLILWLDGSGNFTAWTGGFASSKLPYLYYLRDEGFAILSVFGWSNTMLASYANCGSSYPYPLPTCLKCIETGIDYVLDRYNIDSDEIHIMSKSQGGQCSLYFASYPIRQGIKSIGMFSPVLDYLSMPGESMYADTRKAISADAGFIGDTTYFGSTDYVAYSDEAKAFFQTNINKLIGMNEAWTSLVGGTASERLNEAIDDCKTFWTESRWQHPELTDIYTHTDRAKIAKVPVKIWGASDDADTPYPKMVEIVEQLKNGGCEAVLETLPRGTGDHSCADAGSNKVDSVTTALGYTYTNIPVGWVENVAWIRLHMSK